MLATVLAGALSPPARRPDQAAGSAFPRTAALYALATAAIFCAQELTEGAVAAGHPAGLAAVLAHGGWIALPLAVAAGAVCAVACLLLQGVERTLARGAPSRPARARPSPSPSPTPLPLGPRLRR